MLGRSSVEMTAWAADTLRDRGIQVTGPAEETKRRPWSLVLCLPTTAGTMWAKANAPAFAHEGPLLTELARHCPDRVLAPIGVDDDRGWILSPDGGPTFDGTPAEWAGVVRSYVGLQHTMSAHPDAVRDTGTPFLPADGLVELYSLFESRAPGLRDAVDRYAEILADTGRLSIEHNDLHAGNVFADGRLFDWGDAVLTHPFLSARLFGSDWQEAYFDEWRRYGPVSAAEIDAAERLAPLIGLRTWLAVDTSTGSWAQAVEDLLAALRRSLSR